MGIRTRLQAVAADRIQAHPQPLRQHDECNHGKADQHANQQRQGQKYLFFALGRKHKPALEKSVLYLRFGSYIGGRNAHSSSLLKTSPND